MLLYAVSKTKADILMELSQFDFAIQEYKKVKDLLRSQNKIKL